MAGTVIVNNFVSMSEFPIMLEVNNDTCNRPQVNFDTTLYSRVAAMPTELECGRDRTVVAEVREALSFGRDNDE